MINDQYSNLFTTKSSSYELGGPTLNSKWSWLAMVDRLSGGDVTKHEQVYELNYIYCLNVMGYWHDRDEYVNEINRRNELRNK